MITGIKHKNFTPTNRSFSIFLFDSQRLFSTGCSCDGEGNFKKLEDSIFRVKEVLGIEAPQHMIQNW